MKYLIVFILIIIPTITLGASTYTPIAGIPGIDPTNSNFNTYMNTLYALSIMAAAMLAVIKIIIAGVKWMMTDVVTSKGEAKKDIQNSLLGLLIVLAAVLIISVVNDKILDVNLSLNALPAPTNSINMTTGTGANSATNPGTTTGPKAFLTTTACTTMANNTTPKSTGLLPNGKCELNGIDTNSCVNTYKGNTIGTNICTDIPIDYPNNTNTSTAKMTGTQCSAFLGTIVGSTCNNIPGTKTDSTGKTIINMDSQTCISLGGIMSSGVCSGVPLIN